MNNRLGDLPAWAADPEEDEVDDEDDDIEKGKTQEQPVDVNKDIFFTAVEQIKGEIAQVQSATASIERINEHAQKATTTEKEKELSKQLRAVIDKTNRQAKQAKNLLGDLKEENGKLKEAGAVTNSDLRYEPLHWSLIFSPMALTQLFSSAGSERTCSTR